MDYVASIRHWVNRKLSLQNSPLNSHAVRSKDSSYSYLLLFGACVSCMCNVGMLQTFGVHYATLVKEFGGKSAITGTAWAGSMCFGTSMFIGPFVSVIITKFGNRVTCIVGSILGAIGYFASSYTNRSSEFFFTYGLIVGTGSGLAYLPTVVAVHDYFEKRLSMATGLLVSSSSAGMLLIASLAQALNKSVGWRATMRIESLLFIVSAISASTFVPRNDRMLYDEIGESSISNTTTTAPKTTRCDWSIWRVPSFCLYVAGTSIVMFGYMIPLVYLLDQATSAGIENNTTILPLYGAMALVGKLVFGFLADHRRANHFFLLIFALTTHGISMATIPTATSYIGLALIVTLLGISEGCYIMLRPLLVNRLFGPERLHQAWGFVLSVNSIPYVFGPPAAGAIYKSSGSYTTAFYVGGACELIGCLILSIIPAIKHKHASFCLSPPDTAETLDVNRNPSRDCSEGTSLTSDHHLHKTCAETKAKKNVVDVGSMQGFMAIPSDIQEYNQVSQENVPIIFMRSDVPTASQIVTNTEKDEEGICQQKTKSKFRPSQNFKFFRKEFPSAVALDRATTIASEISKQVVQSAQNVVNRTIKDEPDDSTIVVKAKNSFAVIPYFIQQPNLGGTVISNRSSAYEHGANMSKSYDAVAARNFDLHLEAGAVEQSRIAGLHKYFHDIMSPQISQPEPTSDKQSHVRRQNLLRNIFKRRMQDTSSSHRTSVSFSCVENMLSTADSGKMTNSQ